MFAVSSLFKMFYYSIQRILLWTITKVAPCFFHAKVMCYSSLVNLYGENRKQLVKPNTESSLIQEVVFSLEC